MKHVGILGGTFDPPHLGHMIIAQEVQLSLNLDEVWFIPSHTPPHKNTTKTNAEDRVNMVKLAVQGNAYFKVNTIEIDRFGKSYTFDTIKELNKEYPRCTFYFIIGADMVEYLPKWNRIDQLIKLVQFVGVKRPGFSLISTYPVIEVEVPQIDISSTFIRNRIKNNQPFSYFTPEGVTNYIKEKRLYANGTSG
ncbi:nicotinate-nucleotide adenylyltransferase [Virgibacillus halodenitrificans]|uniref:nicotinate-nucleotide adenylyltransferase n=1 Tax=Virgibacillus halodenitrificans TaxID=1482 RepID=UPI00136B6DC2|nr:nicotinate-nucleotide adenylyltransferase [Virgibacillus halodenitrificans]MYL46645.1 nicotinate-nucleotide adenylyltransferase [Virgibacillus halodenitrificans]